MFNSTWASTLLSVVTSSSQADAIEGDLLEQYNSKLSFSFHVVVIFIALFIYGVSKSPLPILVLSIASVVMSSALTMFLLLPFVFQLVGFSVFSMMLVVCTCRAIACFLVGAALLEYAPKLGHRIIILSSVLMLLVLAFRLTTHYQQWWGFADVSLSVLQSILIYIGFSVLPIILGGCYSQINQSRDVLQMN